MKLKYTNLLIRTKSLKRVINNYILRSNINKSFQLTIMKLVFMNIVMINENKQQVLLKHLSTKQKINIKQHKFNLLAKGFNVLCSHKENENL